MPKLRGAAAGLGADTPEEAAERNARFAAVREGTLGSVHSWELVTAVDGPGTRMTIFLAGCPLRCVYCHNPDTFQMRDGTLQSLDDVVRRIRRYRSVFRAGGGGITISGGEPLFQAAFVRRLLSACREMGVHTAIDTSGYLGAACDDAMIADLDLVLLDVKSGLPEVYRKVTGRELAPTIAFGERLSASGTPIWVRYVLVPDWTDDPANVAAAADIVSQWGMVERVEVLPFHNMGADKWRSLGLDYQLDATHPPRPEAVVRAREVFASRGLAVY